MNKQIFWSYIDTAVQKFPGTTDVIADQRANSLIKALQELESTDLFIFERIWAAYSDKLHKNKIINRADNLTEISNDDDFVAWLILQGKNVVESVLLTPKNLAMVIPDVEFCVESKIGPHVPFLSIGEKGNQTTNPFLNHSYNLKLDRLMTRDEKLSLKYGRHYSFILRVLDLYHRSDKIKELQTIFEDFEKIVKS